MMLHSIFYIIFFSLFSPFISLHSESLQLRDNLRYAQEGDFIVTQACNTLTLLHIYDRQKDLLTVEEISLPQKNRPTNWQTWLNQNAPGHSQWSVYEINLQTGKRVRSYSFTKGYWFELSETDDFLTKMLNLTFEKIPLSSRKLIGPKPTSGPDLRTVWQPPAIVNGQTVRGVKFDAWRTRWPRDQSELAGKMIEVYVPQDNQQYPSYFPYWLQINGAMGRAKVRIIDSGSKLISPKPPLNALIESY